MIGRTIGHYQILEKLGQGGMGAVYKARDTKLNRILAIKVLPPEKVTDPDRIARFIQEAHSASALNNPNIITIHDIASHAEGEFIVMEYVDGRTLNEVIAARESRLPEIIKIAVQVADALAAAHAAGIVHRDLKPANIMVSRTGLIKVLDFGLAKLVAGPPEDDLRTLTTPRSSPGMVLGTVGYMSPEQVKGETLDRRSDIFNFGLILHEMISGTRTFQGETAIEVMSAILREPAPDLPETVPAPLRQIVSVCLEKNPANRFESARDIGFALRAFQSGPSTIGAAPKIEAGKPALMRLANLLPALAFGVATIVLAALYLKRPQAFDLSAYQFTPLAMEKEPESWGVWSPDGNTIAYNKEILGRPQVMVRSLDAAVPTQLTRLSDGASLSFWSPDGSRVFYESGGRLWSVGVAGGEPQELMPAERVLAWALSPDGNTLACWRQTEDNGKYKNAVWIGSPPGALLRKYEPTPFEITGAQTPNYIRFSPDGSKIGISINTEEGPRFWVLDWPDGPKAGQRRPFLEKDFYRPPAFDWLPDSRHVVLALRGSFWLGDTKTGTLRSILPPPLGTGPNEPSVSPDGRRIVFSEINIDLDIIEVPVDGTQPRPYLSTSRYEYSPSWSRSGDRLAYITDRSGTNEIWIRSAKGDWERPVVTQSNFPDDKNLRFISAAISPDGEKLAYVKSIGPSGGRLWVSSSSGGKPIPAIPPHPGIGYFENGLSWSPDSKSLACNIYVEGVSKLAVIGVGGGKPPEFISVPIKLSTAPAWSPDGRWIAFGNDSEGCVFFVSPDGKKTLKWPSPVAPASQGYVLAWANDSTQLYIASSLGEGRLDALDIETGKSRKIAHFEQDVAFFSWNNMCLFGSMSADGRSFVTAKMTKGSDLWILDGAPLPGRRN
jgi:eukaryotic-like serine/threonine-protein kinase